MLDFNPRKKPKCEHCGKVWDFHKAITLACPVGSKTRIGYLDYSQTFVYKPELKLRSRKKLYKQGIEWIACNDNPGDTSENLNIDSIRGYISVLLLADLTEETEDDIAADVVAFRKANPEVIGLKDSLKLF